MNATLAIVLGCLTCFALGATAGMIARDKQIMEISNAMKELMEATVQFVDAIKREYGVDAHKEGEKYHD